MTLRIVREAPPNYQDILAAFPKATMPGTYFCYGSAVFVPIRKRQRVAGTDGT